MYRDYKILINLLNFKIKGRLKNGFGDFVRRDKDKASGRGEPPE